MTDPEVKAFIGEIGDMVLRIESGQIPRMDKTELISNLIGFALNMQQLEKAADDFPPIFSRQMQQVVAQFLALPGNEEERKVLH